MSWNRFFNIVFWLAILAMLGFTIGKYFFLKPKQIVGEAAPAFSARVLGGETLHLADLRGNIVLLDFWGSWCGPCRVENPKINRLLADYGQVSFNEGARFKVVGIAIEEKELPWKKAIQTDQLQWSYHIMDTATSLRFFDSPIAKKYGVRQVPTKYLLNEKGKIVKVNPDAGEIEEYLRQNQR